jgi:hypothetical protein
MEECKGGLRLEPREPELHPRRWTKVHWRHPWLPRNLQ